jgi:hypothetical protein
MDENQGISRRTVTKAAAWSVPLLAVAVAAPLAAASTAPQLNVILSSVCIEGGTGPSSRGFNLAVALPGQDLPAGSVFQLDAGVAILPSYIADDPTGFVTIVQGANANQLIITTNVAFTPGGTLYLGLKNAALVPNGGSAFYELTSLTSDAITADNTAGVSVGLVGTSDTTICGV